jgi:hypothetical protein
MLDRGGATGAAEILVAGDERSVTKQLRRDPGQRVTDLMSVPVGDATEQHRGTQFLFTVTL